MVLTEVYDAVAIVKDIPKINVNNATSINNILRLLAKYGPTEDTLRQWGHLTNELLNRLN